MKRKRGWLLYPLIILAVVLCAVPAFADTPTDLPTMPHPFYGTLTINESPAAVGTVVTAKVGGVECGSITTTVAGQYGGAGAFDEKLNVTGDIATGATISFFVNDIDTGRDYDYAFSPGADPTELDLTAEPSEDTTPPWVTITALTPDPTTDNTPTFTGTATDTLSNISSVEYKVDDGSWIAATASDGTFDSLSEGYTFTTTTLADGAYTVYVRATDAATNTTVEANYASDSFTVTVDTTAPTVSSTSPVADATDVAVDTTVSVTFSEAMDAATITTSSFTLDSVAGSVSYDSGTYTATFTPSANLTESTTYTATLSTAITDVAGNPLVEYSWSFTTGITGAPSVTSTSPAADATDVAVDTTVSAVFDKDMDPSTITASSFTLTGSVVSGTVTYNSSTKTATFTPDANLAAGTTYTATLSPAITSVVPGDANGDGAINALDITKVERIIAGLDAETLGADANEDGNINALDITKVERIIAGLDVTAGTPLAAEYSWSFTTVQ